MAHHVVDTADGLPFIDGGCDNTVVIIGITAEVGCVVEHGVPAGNPAQRVVHKVCAVNRAVVAQGGRPFFVIVDEVDGILGAPIAKLLLKAADVGRRPHIILILLSFP